VAITLQVRTKGTSTVLFDFTDATGAANPSGLKSRLMGFDAGGNTKSTEWFSPSNRDGDTLVFTRHGRRVLGLSLLLEGANADYDSLRAGVEGMISVLEDGTSKEIYWVTDSDVRYIDFQTADLSRILTGDHQGSVFAIDRGKIIGYPLSIYVGPWERNAELDPATNVLTNPTLLLDTNLDGVPDGWTVSGTPLNPVIIPEEQCFEFDADGTLEGYLQDNTAAVAQVWKVSVAARVESGTRDLRLKLEFRDATTALASVVVTTTSATFVAIDVTSAAAPAGTTTARVYIESGLVGSGTGGLRFRNAQLERVS